MNIKRFVASDMREALRAVRSELGPDAVMLSSRPVDGGVEVVAAIDYDDGLLAAVGDVFGGASDPATETPADMAADTAADAAADPLAEYREVAASPAEEPALADERATHMLVDERQRRAFADDRREQAVADDRPEHAVADARVEPAVATVGAGGRIAATRAAFVIGGDRAARTGGSAAPRSATVLRLASAASGHAETARAGTAGVETARAETVPDERTAAAQMPPAAAEQETERLRHELRDLRELLETQLASLAWNDLNRRMPARARVLRQFAAIGVAPNLARELADAMKAAQNPRDAWRLPLGRFADRLPLASRDLADLGGIYAFVGPTGVGKTTTIAKIAARHVLKHGADSIALISTDTYRIGARDQLLTFARILGTPMHTATDARDLGRVLDGLRNKKLVLIDTAGMSQRDVRLAEQFATLRVEDAKVRPVLVLSAATERGALDEALAAFSSAEPKALVITKIDESALLGPILSLAIESRLPVVYVSDGQRVPEDLHVAASKRIWLMQTAVGRARSRPSQLSEDELAARFGTSELAERFGEPELAGA